MMRGRRGNRYVGAGLWGIWTGAAVAVLLVAHLGRISIPATVITLLGTLAATYASWLSYLQSQITPGDREISDIADDFARTVRDQWGKEATSRKIPARQLPIRWKQDDYGGMGGFLQHPRREVLQLLGIAGFPYLNRTRFEGENAELAGKLYGVHGNRVVVLGGPGAGKTVLMIRLVLGLLDIREKGGAVPVLVSAASWDPGRQGMRDWLAGQLIADYPFLGTVPKHLNGSESLAQALLADNKIIPILDGLDEIQDDALGQAVEGINEAGAFGGKLFVNCRADPYAAASLDRGQARIKGTEITLLPPDRSEVAGYLTDNAGSTLICRLEPVIAALRGNGPVAQALSRPLMVDMARYVYVEGYDGPAGTRPDPADLCNQQSLPTVLAVEQYLCRAYVAAAYRGDRVPGRALRAERRLAFLAHHLKESGTNPDIAWWQLQLAVPSLVLATGTGLGAGILLGLGTGIAAAPSAGLAAGAATAVAVLLAVGMADRRWRRARTPSGNLSRSTIGRLALALTVGMLIALAIAVMFGLRGSHTELSSGIGTGTKGSVTAGIAGGIAGLTCGLIIGYAAAWWNFPEPSRGLRWRWSLRSMAVGLGAGIAAGAAVGIPYGISQGMPTGVAVGIAAGLGAGLKASPPDLTVSNPRGALRRDRRASLITASLAALTVCAGTAYGFPPVYGTVIGIACGVPFGAVISILRTAWPAYLVTCAWLALRGRLPWRAMNFLEEAHHKGILRQAGPKYQFRHLELEEYLADRWETRS